MNAQGIASLANSFGPLLRRYRTAAGLTQERLAARAGVSARAISDLERGLKLPRRDTLQLLADALDLPPRKRALLEAAARPHSDPVALRADGATPPSNLAAPVVSLIGRERELATAADLLRRADVRLLTLTGPGGVGKTQLALQVADEALAQFEDGALAVMLGPLRDAALVMQAIRDAIVSAGVGASSAARGAPPGEAGTFVRDYLRERQALLLLDNFEHVVVAAPLVSGLLAACPRLKVLVTSREPLRVAGERELLLSPLDAEAAAELFLVRARAAHPAIGTTAAEMRLARAISAQVDRLPLAIELAAVWARTLPLAELLTRLDARLDLLQGGRRDAPERQRTLRDAIAWSVRLLSDDERALFRRLAIFAGGWAPEAAAAICGESGENVENTGNTGNCENAEKSERCEKYENAGSGANPGALAALAGLVEKSLLVADTHSNTARFAMLETIHEYALEQLDASGEREAIAARHAAYYAQVAQASGEIGPEQDAQYRRLERELPNLRAALAWARARGETGLGLKILMGLGRFFYIRGDMEEGERWLTDLLERDATAGAKAAPPHVRVMALYGATRYALGRRDYDRAEALAQDGLAVAREHGDAAGEGNMLAELGHVAEARGDLDAADAYFTAGMERSRAGRDYGGVGRATSSLGNLARARGDFPRARHYLERALALTRRGGVTWAIAHLLTSLGHVDCEQGDYLHAAASYIEALDLYRAMPNPASLAWCLEGVVATLAAAARFEDAATICGAVASLRHIAHVAAAAEWSIYAQARIATQRALGHDTFMAAMDTGSNMNGERAIAAALAALKGIE